MKIARLGTLSVLILLGAGCLTEDLRQAYPGAPLPANEICTLRVPAMLDVQAIDSVSTDWSLRIRKGDVQVLQMMPGHHRLLVRYYDPTADESNQEVYQVDHIAVDFTAKPQSVHELRYETWAHNPEMRRAREKVRVWAVQP